MPQGIVLNISPNRNVDRSPFGSPVGGQRGYMDPSSIVFSNGSTAAHYLPSGHSRGVVIPHAMVHGGSPAYDPNNPPNRRVIIDPHIQGQSAELDLGAVSPEMAGVAARVGAEFANQHLDEVNGIEALRLATAAAFHLMAAETKTRQEADAGVAAPAAPPSRETAMPQQPIRPAAFGSPPAHPAFQPPQPPAQHPVMAQQPAVQVSAPPPDMLGGFGPQPDGFGPQPAAAHAPVRVQSGAAAVPQRRVYFDIPGFGRTEAYYHDVVIHGVSFVLVYDNGYIGTKYLPNKVQQPFGAWVEGSNVIYHLMSPDITYEVGGRTHCVLAIEKTVPYRPGDEKS